MVAKTKKQTNKLTTIETYFKTKTKTKKTKKGRDRDMLKYTNMEAKKQKHILTKTETETCFDTQTFKKSGKEIDKDK